MTQTPPLLKDLAKTGSTHIRVSEKGLEALKVFREKLSRGEYELVEGRCVCEAGGANRVLIAEEDRYGLPFQTYLCKDCGLLFTSPRMTPGSVAKFYEDDYRAIYRGKSKATQSFFDDQIRHGRQVLRRVAREKSVAKGNRVFDIGCGAGGVLIPFKEASFECYGCDFGSDYLERGRAAGLTLEAGSFEALRQYAPADLIIASHVLEHCLDPIEELRGWASLLAPNGLIYIEVPGLFDVYRSYKSLSLFFHVAHVFGFTLGTLTDVAARAGLERIAGDESVYAIFKPSSPRHEHTNYSATIERFLARGDGGVWKLPRELRRHAIRLAKSIAKRVTKP